MAVKVWERRETGVRDGCFAVNDVFCNDKNAGSGVDNLTVYRLLREKAEPEDLYKETYQDGRSVESTVGDLIKVLDSAFKCSDW